MVAFAGLYCFAFDLFLLCLLFLFSISPHMLLSFCHGICWVSMFGTESTEPRQNKHYLKELFLASVEKNDENNTISNALRVNMFTPPLKVHNFHTGGN